jgi:hypothetical protein
MADQLAPNPTDVNPDGSIPAGPPLWSPFTFTSVSSDVGPITATTEATAQKVIDVTTVFIPNVNHVTYQLRVFIPSVQMTGIDNKITWTLWDENVGFPLSLLATTDYAGSVDGPVTIDTRLPLMTPPLASQLQPFSVRAFVSANTLTIHCGIAGVGLLPPITAQLDQLVSTS